MIGRHAMDRHADATLSLATNFEKTVAILVLKNQLPIRQKRNFANFLHNYFDSQPRFQPICAISTTL